MLPCFMIIVSIMYKLASNTASQDLYIANYFYVTACRCHRFCYLRTAIAIQTANLIQCVRAPSRSVRRLPGHRPDQGIHRADTPTPAHRVHGSALTDILMS